MTTSAQLPIFQTTSYLSHTPLTTAAAYPWASMPPLQYTAAPPTRRKSSSPKNHESAGDGLLFITGNKPADFKKRNVMTKVRKQAMGSYLKDKKPKDEAHGKRARLQSEDSTASRHSTGSEDKYLTQISRTLEDPVESHSAETRVARRAGASLFHASVSGQTRSTSTATPPVYGVPISLNILLPSAPIVQPSRTGVVLLFDVTPSGPLRFVEQSLGKPWDPFRTMFQTSSPLVSVEELKFHCSRFFGTRAMGQHWIPTLVESANAFLSTLCIAATHNDAIHDCESESFSTTALRYEVICLIQQSILNSRTKVDDHNIIAVTQLISSELIAAQDQALAVHEKGLQLMVEMRGGLNKLGVNGRLATTVSWVSLLSSVLREAEPPAMYAEYCASHSPQTYPSTATLPESPLFCPRGDLQSLERSRRFSPMTLDILKDSRTILDLFLHRSNRSQRAARELRPLYKKLLTYPSAARLQKSGNILNRNDWVAETVRLTALLQATAMVEGATLSEALQSAHNIDPTPISTFSLPSRSNSSHVSPTAIRNDSPLTSFSISPIYTTSPAHVQPDQFNYLPTQFSAPSSTFSSNVYNTFPAFPPPAPPSRTVFLRNLRAAIENSDMSDCWGDMAGVLLWVALVAGAASRKSDKILRRWFSALAMRCSIILCFEHPGPICATFSRMTELVEALGAEAKGEAVVRNEKAGSKRRRA